MSESPEFPKVKAEFLDELDRSDITECSPEDVVKKIARRYADEYAHIEGLFYHLMDAFHSR